MPLKSQVKRNIVYKEDRCSNSVHMHAFSADSGHWLFSTEVALRRKKLPLRGIPIPPGTFLGYFLKSEYVSGMLTVYGNTIECWWWYSYSTREGQLSAELLPQSIRSLRSAYTCFLITPIRLLHGLHTNCLSAYPSRRHFELQNEAFVIWSFIMVFRPAHS